MKFSLWTNHGALNSKPVFEAFATSLVNAGYNVVYNSDDADVAVIWSVLWNGRMAANKKIWSARRKRDMPVIVLEIGSINRGTTWKVGLNGINRDAYLGPSGNDTERAKSLKIKTQPWKNSGNHILLCGQHEKSQQWDNMPEMNEWISSTVTRIRQHTNRPIVVRTHPRSRHRVVHPLNTIAAMPTKIPGSYDNYDLSFDDAWAVVNWSSNPGIQAVLEGIPAYVSRHSLAYEVANDIDDFSNIENPNRPDRQQWVNDYAHTEYTVSEIANGIPLKNLTPRL